MIDVTQSTEQVLCSSGGTAQAGWLVNSSSAHPGGTALMLLVLGHTCYGLREHHSPWTASLTELLSSSRALFCMDSRTLDRHVSTRARDRRRL
jgi:hypothetical protein